MNQPQSEKTAQKQNETPAEVPVKTPAETKSLPSSYETKGLDYYGPDDFRERELEVYINNHIPGAPGGNAHDPYGTHITRLAANKMVESYWKKVLKPILTPTGVVNASQDTTDAKENPATAALDPDWESILKQTLASADGYVIFSREVINWLLAQQHCEGIKFYYCRNHDKKKSLVLVGVDKNNCDLGETSPRGSVIDMDLTNIEPVVPGTTAAFDAEKSAIIEVGGPNRFVTLLDAYEDRSDKYGDALRAFIEGPRASNNGQAPEAKK